jgi:hypothetical protein
MAAESRAAATRRKDEERAARMKAEGVVRTTGRCSVCYRMIVIDSWRSRYTHRCFTSA